MAQFERRRGRLEHLPAVGFVGLMGALLASDFFRMGSTPASVGSRGIVIVLATLAAVAIAALAGAQRNLSVGLVVASILAPLVGVALGVTTIALTSPHGMSNVDAKQGALDGLSSAAVFLPAILLILIANRHVGRAREGTIVDGADRRAAYVAAAFSLSIGAPIAVMGSAGARWLGVSLDVTLAIGVLVSVVLLALFILDACAVSTAKAAVSGWETLEPQDPEEALDASPDHHDLGLGEGLLGRVQRANAYRKKPRIESTLRGEPIAVLSALRRSLFRSGAALLVACSATALAFSVAEHTRQTNADPWAPAELIDPTMSKPGLDQLPLSCEAYFAMAGGCVERTVGSERLHLATRLEDVRDAWVTHKNRFDSEASCTAALRDALEHRACVSEKAAQIPTRD